MAPTSPTYTYRKLPGQAWAVLENVRTVAVCDREADAERVAYCLRTVAESEATDVRAQA